MTATEHAVDLVHTAARAASDKLAEDILAFDVSEQLAITDAFLICSAGNDRQVKAIVECRSRTACARPGPSRASRGRAGRSLGPPRLRRHRRARPAHRGARVLRPRAAVARLPDHPAARGRRLLHPWSLRPLRRSRQAAGDGSSGPARPHRLERRGPRPGHTDVDLDDVGQGQAAAMAPVVARYAPTLLLSSDLARARQTAAHVETATGLTARVDARLREYDTGERTGLTVAEYAATCRPRRPRAGTSTATWTPPAPSRSRTSPSGSSRRCRDVLDELEADQTAVLVLHGAALRVGVAGSSAGPWRRPTRSPRCRTAAGRARRAGPPPAAAVGVRTARRVGGPPIRVREPGSLVFPSLPGDGPRGCGAVGSALAWHARGQGSNPLSSTDEPPSGGFSVPGRR